MNDLDQKLIDEVRKFRSGDGEGFAKAIRAVIREEIVNMKAPAERSKRMIPNDCPSLEDGSAALAYWEKHRRPDLVAALDDIAEKFRDYHISHGSKMLRWDVAWRTWYRHAVEYVKPPRDGLFSAPVAFEQTTVQGWEKRLEIFDGLDADCPPGTWSPKWGPKPGELNCRVPPELLQKRRRG